MLNFIEPKRFFSSVNGQHSKLTDLCEKNVQERNREKKKNFACTEAVSEKQRDRWDSRGRLRREEGKDENDGSRGDFYLLGIFDLQPPN